MTLSRSGPRITSASLALILFFVTSPAAAQNTGAPEALVEFVNEVKLGVQVEGGVRQHDLDVLPLTNRSYKYLQRPVRGELSHATPYYGIGLALRARGAEVSAAYWQGDGMQPSQHWLRFRDGSRAFPYSLRFYDGWAVQAEYFILDWVGIGAAYRSSGYSFVSASSFRLDGEKINPQYTLFSGNLNRDQYTLYAPLQREWGGVRFFGRVGASMGRAKDFIYTDFVLFQYPEDPRRTAPREEVPRTTFTQNRTLRTQFGRAGVEVPIWGVAVRASAQVRRSYVPDRRKSWSYDVRVEAGLPF